MKTRNLLYLLIFLTACHPKVPRVPRSSYPVEVTKALEKNAPVFIEALGHIQSMDMIKVVSRSEGELVGIHFCQGQEVKKGDLLFTIDPKPYQADLKKAEGLLEQTLANLALAEQKVKRYKTLTQDEYYSQINYESLQTNYASTLAQVHQAQADVDAAAINLDYCWIYAPIDGLMGVLEVDLGNMILVEDSTVLATLNQMAPIYVTFSIPEVKLPKVMKYHRKNPLHVQIAFNDFQKECFQAQLKIIDNEVNPQTGMIEMRAIFCNGARELWPGQFVRTRLILHTVSNAVMIPFTSVQMTMKGPCVFVVTRNKTVEQRFVKLGQRENENIMVESGVKAGETIVFEGQINLYPGAKIHILEKKS